MPPQYGEKPNHHLKGKLVTQTQVGILEEILQQGQFQPKDKTINMRIIMNIEAINPCTPIMKNVDWTKMQATPDSSRMTHSKGTPINITVTRVELNIRLVVSHAKTVENTIMTSPVANSTIGLNA